MYLQRPQNQWNIALPPLPEREREREREREDDSNSAEQQRPQVINWPRLPSSASALERERERERERVYERTDVTCLFAAGNRCSSKATVLCVYLHAPGAHVPFCCRA